MSIWNAIILLVYCLISLHTEFSVVDPLAFADAALWLSFKRPPQQTDFLFGDVYIISYYKIQWFY